MDIFLKFLIRFLDILAWPIVVLILVCIFKDNLRFLIDRIRFWKFKDMIIGTDLELLDKGKPPKTHQSATNESDIATAQSLSLDKPATLFWMANDVMWIQDMLIRNASSRNIILGLNNLLTYIKSIGLKGSFVDKELSRLAQETEATLTYGYSEWSPEYRLSLIRQIESIKWFLAARVEEAEPGFKKLRVLLSRRKKSAA